MFFTWRHLIANTSEVRGENSWPWEAPFVVIDPFFLAASPFTSSDSRFLSLKHQSSNDWQKPLRILTFSFCSLEKPPNYERKRNWLPHGSLYSTHLTFHWHDDSLQRTWASSPIPHLTASSRAGLEDGHVFCSKSVEYLKFSLYSPEAKLDIEPQRKGKIRWCHCSQMLYRTRKYFYLI